MKFLLNILFPQRCVGCAARGSVICDPCAKKLQSAEAPKYSWITSIFSYKDSRVRALIRSLKYKHAKSIADVLGVHLASSVSEFLGEEKLFLSGNILLVPVPLSRRRYRQRGYNQSELLAEALVRELGAGNVSVDSGLVRKHADTKPQADIKNKNDRLRNLGDCFSATRKSHGESIVIIDDVTTTGATLVALRRALKEKGFRNIHAFTIAH